MYEERNLDKNMSHHNQDPYEFEIDPYSELDDPFSHPGYWERGKGSVDPRNPSPEELAADLEEESEPEEGEFEYRPKYLPNERVASLEELQPLVGKYAALVDEIVAQDREDGREVEPAPELEIGLTLEGERLEALKRAYPILCEELEVGASISFTHFVGACLTAAAARETDLEPGCRPEGISCFIEKAPAAYLLNTYFNFDEKGETYKEFDTKGQRTIILPGAARLIDHVTQSECDWLGRLADAMTDLYIQG